jgi:glycosyltransferase involved in cell wall biosynthesis
MKFLQACFGLFQAKPHNLSLPLMNIALWAPFFKKDVSDVEDFIVETIPDFILQHPNDKFFILMDAELTGQFAFPANTEIVITKTQQKNALLKKIWWDVKLPSSLKKIKADLFISFADRCSLTATIPQFIFGNEPEKLKPPFIKKARLVFVMSESIKGQLIKSHKISGEKIIVIYPAPGKNYLPTDVNRKDHAKEEYSEGKEFFLYNSVFNKQDLIELLKSFSHFKKRQQSNFKLLLLMESDSFIEKTLSAYKYKKDVKFIGLKDKSIKAVITAAAYAAILPFNTNEDIIAALNAMKSGVPVITTKSSAIIEVAEDAVLCADKEIKDIGEKMMQLYTNENLRSERIEKGIEKVKGFTCEKVAESLWQSIIRAYK